jgi:hypothetical protein
VRDRAATRRVLERLAQHLEPSSGPRETGIRRPGRRKTTKGGEP